MSCSPCAIVAMSGGGETVAEMAIIAGVIILGEVLVFIAFDRYIKRDIEREERGESGGIESESTFWHNIISYGGKKN